MSDRYGLTCPNCEDTVWFLDSSEPSQCPTCKQWFTLGMALNPIDEPVRRDDLTDEGMNKLARSYAPYNIIMDDYGYLYDPYCNRLISKNDLRKEWLVRPDE